MPKSYKIIFWGHDFFSTRQERLAYQERVTKAIWAYNKKSKTNYCVLFGDFPSSYGIRNEKDIKSHPYIKRIKANPKKGLTYFFDNIYQFIKNADITVFDLNFRKKKNIRLKLKINYNVLFEYGIAIGLLKKGTYILCKNVGEAENIVSDIKGVFKFPYNYNSHHSFENAITELLRQYLLDLKIK